ncbi:hypothetical protein F2Q68_00038587 [Brassica cretica]|uniref:Uncharacterized protein n=1 Tax=Brassica cretica TaxID=69181 RepID=A0A8S9MHZ1_BRACR|nr:hypothetical protein F2Q68_00038587 [Brassica cretica]
MRRSGNGDGGCGGDSISRRLLVFDTGTTFCSQEVEAVMADVVEVQEQSSIYVIVFVVAVVAIAVGVVSFVAGVEGIRFQERGESEPPVRIVVTVVILNSHTFFEITETID